MREFALPLEKIEELQDRIGLQDRSCVKVEFTIDDTIADCHGDDYVPFKFVITDTAYDRSNEVLVKQDEGKLQLMIPICDSEPEEYSDGLFWMHMYYDNVRSN